MAEWSFIFFSFQFPVDLEPRDEKDSAGRSAAEAKQQLASV